MITIFVGDVHQYLADRARLHDSAASLITEKNYKKISAGTWYCSIGDFGDFKKFVHVLRQADEIIYAPPNEWQDVNAQINTEKYLLDLKILEFKNVKNIDNLKWPKLKTFLALADDRKTEDPQLWIAGCSISHGMGVTADQRYGQLIANHQNLSVSFLTCPGSSVMWAADQILRSDIRPGDTVIWGITSFERFCYYIENYYIDNVSKDNQLAHVGRSHYMQNPKFNSIIPLDELSSQNQIYQAITKIYQVLNFCEKIKVKCILAGLLTVLTHYNIIDDRYICLTQEYKFYPRDMTNRDLHPDSAAHQHYASQILKKLNC